MNQSYRIKNVLLVDDDYEMLQVLREGFAQYRDTFSVQLATDGRNAIERLKKNTVSLVVTDLKMPGMDGFGLLAHIMEYYPDIQVIIITGYSTPEREHLAREGGAIGYVAKPFLLENLAHRIITTLQKESEGGVLHNVTPGMFLQLIEMEQKSCTIRLKDKLSNQKGVLFFHEGELLDARVDDLQGEDAAYEVLGWDQVNLSIQNGCGLMKKRIHSEMQYLILEAARRKDENLHAEVPETSEPFELDSSTFLKGVKEKITMNIGPACGMKDIYQDPSWDRLVWDWSKTGESLNIGKLKLGFIDKGETYHYIVLPTKKTTVISVTPKCPRDRLIHILTG